MPSAIQQEGCPAFLTISGQAFALVLHASSPLEDGAKASLSPQMKQVLPPSGFFDGRCADSGTDQGTP